MIVKAISLYKMSCPQDQLNIGIKFYTYDGNEWYSFE